MFVYFYEYLFISRHHIHRYTTRGVRGAWADVEVLDAQIMPLEHLWGESLRFPLAPLTYHGDNTIDTKKQRLHHYTAPHTTSTHTHTHAHNTHSTCTASVWPGRCCRIVLSRDALNTHLLFGAQRTYIYIYSNREDETEQHQLLDGFAPD